MTGITLNQPNGYSHQSSWSTVATLVMGSAIALTIGTPTQAEPLATLELGEMPLRNQALTAGPTKVIIIEFDPLNYDTGETQYLTYEVYVNDEFQTQVRQEVDFRFADFSLQNLDPDGVPEVIFHRYTGGAHCCSIYTIYSAQGDRLHRTLTYPLDAAGAGGFEDLDGDGYSEFLSADQRFLYAFGSYASSWPPNIFLTFRNGSLIDTTRQFPDRLRSTAYTMYEHTRDHPGLGANSILAGYVGQKILMGEYESGWDYMLAHYDDTDTWGLTEYSTDGEEIGTFADYPEALESFLLDLGYLTVNGDPNPNLDLSRVIVEQEALL
ncbi:hypothetical protein [Leptolyngbya iicbica]|uniref:VCBS repeat-containing protein n=2 Tax=Cyanophyceae TaxID=3028117 RepID=A0A4Q7E5M0_9CYAN|nr:hypothetical protein [Leptolyngbya sp. LK]RZM77145.1 hypothetical protein DYY88_15960 [Leptolyngbya sp. LK]